MLLQIIQFCISRLFSFIWLIDRTLSGAPTSGQRWPCDSNKEVLRISQSSSITGTSPSQCLASYPRHVLYGVLPHWRGALGVFYSPTLRGNYEIDKKNYSMIWINKLFPRINFNNRVKHKTIYTNGGSKVMPLIGFEINFNR